MHKTSTRTNRLKQNLLFNKKINLSLNEKNEYVKSKLIAKNTFRIKNKINLTKNIKKNDLFLKQLIDSDFIYSRKSIDQRVPGIVNSTLQAKQENVVCTLDIFKLNKSLKQFAKILELLKLQQNFCIFILCKNKHYLRLIDRMTKNYSLKNIVKTCTILPDLSNKIHKDYTKFLFILGEYELTNNFLFYLRYYRINLISKFNLKYERKTLGFYKIQNNLDDYKKLLFLFVLIQKKLGKKNAVNLNLQIKDVINVNKVSSIGLSKFKTIFRNEDIFTVDKQKTKINLFANLKKQKKIVFLAHEKKLNFIQNIKKKEKKNKNYKSEVKIETNLIEPISKTFNIIRFLTIPFNIIHNSIKKDKE